MRYFIDTTELFKRQIVEEGKCEMWAKIRTLRPEPLVGEEVGADVDADGDDVGAELGAVLDIIGGEFSVYCGLEPMESAEKKELN